LDYCDRAHNQSEDVPTQSDQFKTPTTGERLHPDTAILSVRHLTTVAERPLFGSTMAGEDYPIGVPQTNRFAAGAMPPNAEGACCMRAHSTCRSALRARWRRSSFWRVNRHPSGYGWRYPQHRMPSASPHAVRTALAASRTCFCCCAPINTSAIGVCATRCCTRVAFDYVYTLSVGSQV